MDQPISATELARGLGDVLGRIRYRNESFVVERNGVPVARLVPIAEGGPPTLKTVLDAWSEAGLPDPSFADDLERARATDQPPEDPWGS